MFQASCINYNDQGTIIAIGNGSPPGDVAAF